MDCSPHQAPPSMEFSRQEYWSGLPFPSQGDLPHPGIEPGSPASWADAEPPGNPFPSVSLSHQEASISLLFFSIRGQIE